ncbi:MAG: cell division protein FtsZ, partial [Flavobacteriaceae bacterium]|nr:cell division protein FtsZ [Flavobacteriaceae bacterium]
MSNSKEFENITFDLPKNRSNVIKVIGVGGGGSNAINHMFRQGINGVDFVVCNTDAQALENSPVPTRIQLGLSLTEGMGAGANPQVGEQAALESQQEIQNMLSSQTKMVFITAGMGGGTGTGAAPVIAKIAKEMNILTVGIVTVPFQFEGKMRNEQAQEGVERLRETIDSLIIINNNKLREVYGNLGFKSGFAKADEVLATAARGIAEVITHHYMQNIDLRDAKTVLANSGTAIMGSATAKGANRAQEAITQALDSPLLNDNKITGAKNVLLLIVSGTQEITIDEIGEINDHIQSEAGNNANIIMGVGEDSSQDEAISITIIATGFGVEQQDDIVNTEAKKIIHTLEDDQCAEQVLFSGKIEKPVESIPVERKPKFKANPEELIIKHNLFEDSEQEIEALPFEGYIKTSELIKNIDIVCEEIITSDLNEFNPASILDIGVDDFEIVSSESTDDVNDLSNESNDFAINSNDEDNNTTAQEDEQILMFDIPLNPKVKEPDLSEKTLNP